MDLNEFDRSLCPTLKHGDLEIPDLSEIGDFVAKLSGAGIDLTDDETANALRRIGKLPTDVECGCGIGE